MNNVLAGGRDPRTGEAFVYYETVAGGHGASARGPGASGRAVAHDQHAEYANRGVGVRVPAARPAVQSASGSGGAGLHNGGDGIVREIEFLAQSRVTVVAERRSRGPWGLNGGGDGAPGAAFLIRNGKLVPLEAKTELTVEPGDILRIETPGGGAWGHRSE